MSTTIGRYQARVLAMLAERGEIAQAELARLLCPHPQAHCRTCGCLGHVARALRSLCLRDLVQRRPADRRGQWLVRAISPEPSAGTWAPPIDGAPSRPSLRRAEQLVESNQGSGR